MVKKKKNRHQQEPATQNGGDSTESCDENQANNTGGKCCSHVTKAVDLTKVKKALRAGGIVNECAECAKTPTTSNGLTVEGEMDVGLWLCLKCGHQACGRSWRQHALKHHQTPRSEPHALVVNTELWNIWCYECGCEISAKCRKKLHECVEFIKRQEEAPASSKKRCDNGTERNGDTSAETLTKSSPTPPKNNKVPSLTGNLPRVRGLCNVGNTCFFNAVLQCLAQTPFLLPVLQEISEPGGKFQLPGQHTTEADLPALEGELGKWGNLTEILASTLIELQSPKCDVFNPTRLLNKLIQRCPQFGGGEQHDSHELLRHLLEGVRTEDLKRFQSAILHLFGLSEKSNPTEVEDEVRSKAKAYGRQAAEMMLHPEQVFRGFLVSTLECQDCLHTSHRVESFLDLSLPVMADKPQPPVMRRKSNNDESFDMCGNLSECQPSKHQLKKERKQARKERKRQKGWRAEGGEQPSIAEENAAMKNSGESEQSDADVEDNVEQDVGSRERCVDVGESGYSSEKLGNEDSAIESPLPHLANGDSVLASPASPADLGGSMSPVCSGDVAETSKELVVTIPASPLESVGSLLSNRESPSPVSSEVNIDCSSSISTRAHGDCASPVCNRPVSRFAFCHDDDMDSGERVARFSPVEDDPGSAKNLVVTDLCEDISRLCASLVLAAEPNLNGCKEKQLVCGGNMERMAEEEEAEFVMDSLGKGDTTSVMTSDIWSNGETASEVQSNAEVASKGLLNGEVASELSNGELALLTTDVWSNGKVGSELQSNGEEASEVQSHEVEASGVQSIEMMASKIWLNGEVGNDVQSNRVMTSEVQSIGEAVSEVRSNGEMASWSATVSPRYQCGDGECSIQSCLNQFTALELMTGNNKVGCENCTQRQNQGKEGKMVCTNSTKQLLVKSPPAVLILHLKRFQVHRSMFRKMSRHVGFPLVLDLAPICSAMYKDSLMMKPGQNQVLYALYGVVEHSGTLHGGHYVAYVKVRAPVKDSDPRWSFLPSDPQTPRHGVEKEDGCLAVGGSAEAPPGKWYFVSDSRVNEVGEDRVLRSQAYLLFYERIW